MYCTSQLINGEEFNVEICKGSEIDLQELDRFRTANYLEKKPAIIHENHLSSIDDYDLVAYHFNIKKNNEIVAHTRVVLNNESNLEIVRYMNLATLDKNFLCGEVSRLLVSPEFRNGKIANCLYKTLIDFGRKYQVQFAFIFFEDLKRKSIYYNKLGFEISKECFIYTNERSWFHGKPHRLGLKQLSAG